MNTNEKEVEVKEEIKEEVLEEVNTEQETEVKEKPKKEKKDKNKELIENLTAEVATLKDELLRNRAEVENFKKRMNEEKIKDRKYASINLITDLIQPVEYLAKACNMTTEDPNLSNFLIGFKMLSTQITDVLKQDGLEEIDSLNQKFDPSLHHAVEKVKVEGVEADMIVEELSKAYKYKDRIVKPAMVKVSE